MWSTWKIIFILVPLVPFAMFSPICEKYHYQHTILILQMFHIIEID
jgi:hypothetical protein